MHITKRDNKTNMSIPFDMKNSIKFTITKKSRYTKIKEDHL